MLWPYGAVIVWRLTPFRPLFPCVLWFTDITWSKEMGPIFQRGLNKWVFSYTKANRFKSSNIEKQAFSTKNDVILKGIDIVKSWPGLGKK